MLEILQKDLALKDQTPVQIGTLPTIKYNVGVDGSGSRTFRW